MQMTLNMITMTRTGGSACEFTDPQRTLKADLNDLIVYQEYVEPTVYSGRYPVIGSWIIGGEAAGIGIRENRMEVTDNLSEFVPHIIG